MKKDTYIASTVVPGTIGVAVGILASRIPFSAESIVGFTSVLVLGGIAALEYRLNLKA